MKTINGLLPYILGISSTRLTEEEIKFFTRIQPYGIILFTRNLESREQIIKLNEEIHSIIAGVKIFIDQEGGRVQRIKPPIGLIKYKAQKYFGDLYKDNKDEAISELTANYLQLSEELAFLGFDASCAPVCDLYHKFCHEVIMGDRTFSDDPVIVSILAKAALDAMQQNRIEGVIKHIPGHGRALQDSHIGLPIIDSDIEDLYKTDFQVFQNLKDAKYAMTAHIIYSAIDNEYPCTISKKVIDYIRTEIGFTGLIMTDDICMKALSGDLAEIAKQSFNAGCDLVLHCSGNMQEMIRLESDFYNFL
jgi:beta-glucosidase-like glycosyl hydrolase